MNTETVIRLALELLTLGAKLTAEGNRVATADEEAQLDAALRAARNRLGDSIARREADEGARP